MIERICVFAGSNPGTRPEYAAAARALGAELAARGLGLVYGGSSVGLMGVVADAALAAGGSVVGVIPRALFPREVVHAGLADLRVTGSMHERKAQMVDLADAFVALPGGLGTFDELFEVLTWAQLGLHAKPIGLLDVAGYFAPLLVLIAHAEAEGFVPPHDRDLLLRAAEPAALLDALLAHRPVARGVKWIAREES
jgi:uncharacterized protein (TIGR00730 family)